ncbi:hypothetical protein ABTD55_23380, partial [Acinetobacter baumannii]
EGSGGRRGRRGGATVEANTGENPPLGLVVNYYLKGVTDSSKCSITLFDKQQKPLKTFSTSSREAADKLDINEGMNQFVW